MGEKPTSDQPGKIRLFNTLSRQVEELRPLAPPTVTFYTCGMTVYYLTHIGHLRTYTFSDVLRRLLESSGYEVKQVMNVTDVGHMTSDADEGEDKLDVGARREGKTPREIARHYEEHFFDSIARVNIKRPHVVCRATDHIDDMIDLIRRLDEKGLTYRTGVGVIFDTSKIPHYADLGRLNLEGQRAGARVAIDEERRNPWDFALWVTNQPTHIMQWESPWGRGFPGWHIECSAMSMKYLGDEIDIHGGGVDHIPIHHTNEIAQSEGATGRRFVRHWFHCDFLMVEKTKMSKSLENLFTLDEVVSKGCSPLALRYFYLGGSYRKTVNFTWEALRGDQKALVRLWQRCAAQPEARGAEPDPALLGAFSDALADDLNTARALAVVWEAARKEPTGVTAATLARMDEVLGLDLANAADRLAEMEAIEEPESHPGKEEATRLAEERVELRRGGRYEEADGLRRRIEDLGFSVEDTREGFRLHRPT